MNINEILKSDYDLLCKDYKKATKKIEKQDKEIERLKNRIDKAIEYLENWEVNFYAYDTGEDKDNINDLLDILKGEENGI